MKPIYKYLLLLLSLLTGVTFLFSAYTKLVPIQAFEYTLVEDALMGRQLAAFAARFFIGLEAGLGTLMLFHFFGKCKWILKTAFCLVVIFSIYLIYLWIKVGNNVNCGCFGDAVWMSPAESLVKNAALLIVLGLLIRYHDGFSYQWSKAIAPLTLAMTIVLTFILFPVFKPHKVDLAAIYAGTDVPTTDLSKGKHIIAFLSPSCIHCRRTALRMHEDHAKDSTLPFYMILGGTKSDLAEFWKASHAQDLPYIRLDKAPFLKYTGGVFPYIIWVNNGIIQEETNWKDLTPEAIERWMKY